MEIIHFCKHLASSKIRISKFQDFGNFKLSPMNIKKVEYLHVPIEFITSENNWTEPLCNHFRLAAMNGNKAGYLKFRLE